jgi:hypothetical protein
LDENRIMWATRQVCTRYYLKIIVSIGGMSPLISSISSWYNGSVCYNCSWFCSTRILKLLCSAFICYTKAGQLQLSGGPHNCLRNCLRATRFFFVYQKGRGRAIEFTWMLFLTNSKLCWKYSWVTR